MKKNLNQVRSAALLVFISISPHYDLHEPKLAAHIIKSVNTQVNLRLVTNQVRSPIALGVPEDGSKRLFIAQKEGKIGIVRNGSLVVQPFLDMSSQMVSINPGYDERGLLGLTFHPDFKVNHTFYVFYSAPSDIRGSDHKGVLAEYKVSANNPDKADPSTKRVMLEVEEPESNHNGGNIAFGPDGYLYICLGDGGGGGDRHGSYGNGQNLANLLGKILRIDVKGQPYSVPKDNPFVNRKDARPEIWAYGLRNPWRFSFDKKTGQLFTGDVGQNKYEEVDIITKGGNYGWRIKEGFHDFDLHNSAPMTTLVEPIFEYGHNQGISIAGGYVYRGGAIPELQGKYVYGDYNSKMWVLTKTGSKWINSDLEVINKPRENMQLLSWGEDEDGELYALVSFSTSGGAKGGVYKMVK